MASGSVYSCVGSCYATVRFERCRMPSLPPVHTNTAARAPIRTRPAPPPPRLAPAPQWLAEELPRVRRLWASIRSDLAARVAPLGRVNVPLHFLSRASVALVPFGVMTVNLLGACRGQCGAGRNSACGCGTGQPAGCDGGDALPGAGRHPYGKGQIRSSLDTTCSVLARMTRQAAYVGCSQPQPS